MFTLANQWFIKGLNPNQYKFSTNTMQIYRFVMLNHTKPLIEPLIAILQFLHLQIKEIN